ncbi:hypothetical protein Acr_01g0004420 [Actinidia rufa]|uniref:Uncharacterized protein n=1 Tax=Actinidia rufa TaxID=165716 RepID=A0A7J0E287_9ERIC|nr:hypothetical protein Acr_01g0004420 [Actinidia rufa]
MDLAKGAGVGEGVAGGAASVAKEGAGVVGGRREGDERGGGVQRVLYEAVGVATVLVEEEVALPVFIHGGVRV